MPTCNEPMCVSLATRGDKCAVHGAGYKRAAKDEELRCGRCKWKFRVGEWYRLDDATMTHVGRCPATEE